MPPNPGLTGPHYVSTYRSKDWRNSQKKKKIASLNNFYYSLHFKFFWWCLRYVEVPGLGIKLAPQQ